MAHPASVHPEHGPRRPTGKVFELRRRPLGPGLPSVDDLVHALPPRPEDFRSPVHHTWVVAQLGRVLGIAVGVCFVTGLLSHNAQSPSGFALIPAPSWGYRLTQGLHVATGIASIPLLLAKVFAAYPRLFARPVLPRPDRRGLPTILERGSIAVLVGAAFFEVTTGLLNINQWYVFGFYFVPVHYSLAWIMTGALLVHIAVKLPIIRHQLAHAPKYAPSGSPVPDQAVNAARRGPDVTGPDVTGPGQTQPDDNGHHERGPDDPGPTSDRRGFILGALGVSAVLTAVTVGESVTPLSGIAVLAPRRPGHNVVQGLPVNKTAGQARLTGTIGRSGWGDRVWRLTLEAPGFSKLLGLSDLAALEQVTVTLPIACVEGWSVDAEWSGVRVRDLVQLAGGRDDQSVRVVSLEQDSPYSVMLLQPGFAAHPHTLLATRLNGEVLDLDHGYPARIIAPNRPGVLQTKWVDRLEVLA